MPTSSPIAKRVSAFTAIVLSAICTSGVLAQERTFTTFAGPDGGPGWFDGLGTNARFSNPVGIARDSAGNFYVADGNHTIRKLTPGGEVTTLAGTAGVDSSIDGSGGAARFAIPSGVAVDTAGNLFVVDFDAIRRVTPAGRVSTIAGVFGKPGSADGNGAAARFFEPNGVAVDASGNLYVADTYNHTLRKISPEGNVTTLAGVAGVRGSQDGAGAEARFYQPWGVVIDPANGNLFVSDAAAIRKVTPAGVVTTFAGDPMRSGGEDGPPATAHFGRPAGMALDAGGNLFVADMDNHAIRKVDTAGNVTTIAGLAGESGMIDDTGSAARFDRPTSIVVDSVGDMFVTDSWNDVVRKVTSGGVVSTFGGKSSGPGILDGVGTAARFRGPEGIAVDETGNTFVADMWNCTIRTITPDGIVSTLAGSPGQCGSADGNGSAARFRYPDGIAVDSDHNVYVADTYNDTIRKVTPAGDVTTFAGSPGVSGSTDGLGTAARFSHPQGVAVDADGNVFVADTYNQTIRRITPQGEVTTFAGLAGSSGTVDGNGANARLAFPNDLAIDSNGIIYVASVPLRRITPAADVTTLSADVRASAIAVSPQGVLYVNDLNRILEVPSVGNPVLVGGVYDESGSVDGTGPAALFDGPASLALKANGDLLVTERGNNRIRVGRPALAGSASINNPAGFVGAEHHLGFSGAATAYTWRVTRRPSASSATLVSATDAAPLFVPDVNDAFEFELVASDGVSSYIGRTNVMSPALLSGWNVCSEGASPVTVDFALTEPLESAVTFDWVTRDGTAVAGPDYVAATGSVTFAPGEILKSFPVEILDDEIADVDEYFSIELENVTGIQSWSSALVLIGDNDPPPTITISDVAVSEGDAGTTDAVFTIALSGISSNEIVCSVETAVATASSGTDFLAIPQSTLSFHPGETTKTVAVKVIGDTEGEDDETFLVNLSWPVYAVLGDSQGVGTITNDDLVVGNPPNGLSASATSPSSVGITWNPVAGATGYRIFRKSVGTGYVQIGTPSAATFTDNAVSAGKSYLYKVRATDGPLESVDSAADLATTITFTDPTLIPGVTTSKSSHVTEIRSAVNAVRQLAGLTASSFTDPVLASAMTIKAVHLTELRSAIDAARASLGLPAISYTDAVLQPGVTRLKAAHVTELRDAVR